MLTLSNLAEIMQESLNNNEFGINFRIDANVADFIKERDKPLNSTHPTRGIVRLLSGEFTPVKNLDSFNTIVVLELLVPQSQLPKVEQIVNKYASVNVGETTDIDGYQVVINFDVPTVGRAANSIVGSGVPVQMIATYKFIRNGFYGNQMQYYIVEDAGETLLTVIQGGYGNAATSSSFQELGATVGRDINTQNNDELSLSFVMLDTPFYQALMQEILGTRDQNKVYTFRFYLENKKGEEVLNVTKKFVRKSGAVQIPQNDLIVINCTFSPAHELIGG